MSTINLKDQIIESSNELCQIEPYLKCYFGLEIPSECWDHWRKSIQFRHSLEESTKLIDIRDSAWSNITRLDTDKADDIESLMDLDFPVERHLALVAYMSVTWSLYDRLANICGRIAGVPKITNPTNNNPKICKEFLVDKDAFGFNLQFHIKSAYAWPLNISYQIRNWLVHEGLECASIFLFENDSPSDGFRLTEDAANTIEEKISKNIDLTEKCCNLDRSIWKERNLIKILVKYNAEIDTMYTALIRWTINSLIEQIRAFTLRDKSRILSQLK